jgi:tetratricopeptide (TPR) repeat protein
MRQTKLVFALLGLLSLGLSGCQRLQARDNLNKGVRAFREANYPSAVDFFKQAIALDPELVNAELYLATAYSQQFIPGAFSEENRQHAEMAIATFENVLSRDSVNTSAIAGLASIYQNTNQLDKAREHYLQQAGILPDDAVANYSVGSLNWMIVFDKTIERPIEELSNLIEEGQQYLDKALALNENYEDAMSYKNLLYRQAAELIAADPDAEDPEAAEAEAEERRLEILAMADEWFNKALETRQTNAEEAAEQLGGEGT